MARYSRESLLERFYDLHKGRYKYEGFEYRNTNQRINIVCEVHGVFAQKIRKHLEGQGCKRCAGIATSSKWINPTGYREPCGKQVQYQDYTVWRAMNQRSKPEYWIKHPHYSGTTISEDFLSWDKYKDWCDSQFNSGFVDEDGKPFELDKDLLSKGARHYSEETCCFLPRAINVGIRNKTKHLPKLFEKYKDSLTKEAYDALISYEVNIDD